MHNAIQKYLLLGDNILNVRMLQYRVQKREKKLFPKRLTSCH